MSQNQDPSASSGQAMGAPGEQRQKADPYVMTTKKQRKDSTTKVNFQGRSPLREAQGSLFLRNVWKRYSGIPADLLGLGLDGN